MRREYTSLTYTLDHARTLLISDDVAKTNNFFCQYIQTSSSSVRVNDKQESFNITGVARVKTKADREGKERAMRARWMIYLHTYARAQNEEGEK